MGNVLNQWIEGISYKISNMRYADDTTLVVVNMTETKALLKK